MNKFHIFHLYDLLMGYLSKIIQRNAQSIRLDHHLPEIDIQPDDHVAFIHIPKTAGTTFNAILEPVLSELPSYFAHNLTDLLSIELADLRKYYFLSGHFPYDVVEQIFPKGFIGLTFLRNPLGRIISNFNFFHQLLQSQEENIKDGLSNYADELEQIKKMTLLELFEHSEFTFTRDLINAQIRFISFMGKKKAQLTQLLYLANRG